MFRIFILLFGFLHLFYCGSSQIKLPRLISNGMVLQRNALLKIWGWATPNEKIKIEFKKEIISTIADRDGNWSIQLSAQKAGGPYEIHLTASNKIDLTDIYFGDVWLCSGQSNMEINMSRVQDKYPQFIASANNPQIRQFIVPDKYDFNGPQKDFDGGEWKALDSKSVYEFSAVALFFAEKLFNKYKVPIGLINSALGGSPVESWISEDSLRKFPEDFEEMQKFKNKELIAEIENRDRANSSKWYRLLRDKDEGLKKNWQAESFNDSDWEEMDVPGYWADGPLGITNGSVWFRKWIDVPPAFTGKSLKLLLGRIVDADSVFVNGKFAGTIGYQYPPRRYIVPAGLFHEGRNLITVRIISNSGRGGFVPDKPYALILGNDSIDLKGKWKYKLGIKMDPTPEQTFIRWKPGGLYNAMIAPMLNYKIKGVIWYQGESNANNAMEYAGKFSTLIRDWRAKWKMGNFPFLYVQLPNFMETKSEPGESDWARVREAQRKTLSIPNTGMAVAIDLGEWNDIHPLNKKPVGERLALQAMHLAYGDKNLVYSGPLLKSASKSGNKIILNFSNVGKGLIAFKGKSLKYFSIAGPDGKYIWANATMNGSSVSVWSKELRDPISVRYAWADNPAGANLYNKEELPASPFEVKIK
ncbi:MAG: sialate O-acetylesterase [Bacteroidetes bacterium]|nr:MAG: sialate O-acetylesterase [Bacteroidota bacterium]